MKSHLPASTASGNSARDASNDQAVALSCLLPRSKEPVSPRSTRLDHATHDDETAWKISARAGANSITCSLSGSKCISKSGLPCPWRIR